MAENSASAKEFEPLDLDGPPAWRVWAMRALYLAAALTVAFFVYRRSTRSKEVKRTIVTQAVERGDIAETVSASGTIYPVNQVDVGSQISGVLAEISTDRNRTVTAGDVIARIEPSRYEAALAQARAAASAARADVERAKVLLREAQDVAKRATELAARGASSTVERDTALLAVERAQADIKSAQARVEQAYAAVKAAGVDLDHTFIRAPISGVVIKRSVEVGQTVAASLQAPILFQIAQDLSEMEVRAAVDQADVGKLKAGQSAEFTVAGVPEPFEATVHEIWLSPTVTQTVVTYDVILRVKNRDNKLLPQMTANIKITATERNGVLKIPNSALRVKPPRELLAESDAGQTGIAKSETKSETAPVVAAPSDRKATGGADGRGKGRKMGGKPPAKVYVKGADGKLTAVEVKTGITDGASTELLSSGNGSGTALTEGSEIVTEIRSGAAAAQPAAAPGGQRGGRGPRF